VIVCSTGKTGQIALAKRGGHQLALAPPVFALGGEHAVQAELTCDALHRPHAPEALGPLEERTPDQVCVPDSEAALGREPKREQIAVALAPSLEPEMKPCQLDLMQVAEQGQSARSGQLAELPPGWCRYPVH
jgi:hypothetical protein